MKRILNLKVAFAGLVLGIGAMGYVSLLPQSHAMPSPGVCTYYSNAKFKTVVGQQGTGCCGEFISWGQITQFRKCEQVYCLDIVCPNPTE